MKVNTKIKVDKQAIADFFLYHVEKIVFGLIVACFLLMLYFSAVRPTYSRPPEELAKSAIETHKHIDATPADLGKKLVIDYPKRAEAGQQLINVDGYAMRTGWDQPVFPRPRKRADPALLAVQKPIGAADRGPFTLKAETAGGANADHGQRWIVVTGVVPFAEQVEAYNEAFKDMRRPETDTPNYAGYTIERAEVVANVSEANLNWVPTKMTAALAVTSAWASSASEVVPAQFLRPTEPQRLVFPLGPLTGRTWDERVAHPPEIPLASATPETSPAAAGGDGTKKDNKPGEMFPDTPAPAAATGTTPPAEKDTTPAAKCLLFRYFDFTVEPEKTYRYRFQLGLANPNRGFDVRYLLNVESATKTHCITGWSEPTAPITVPRDDQLLAKGVKLPARSSGEPEATVMMVKWLANNGAYAQKEFPKMLRGQLLNFSAAGAEGADEVHYQSDSLLLDIHGGERFPGHDKGAALGEILIWNYDHTLVVRNEADDQAEVERAAKLAPPPPVAKQGGGTTGQGGDSLFGGDQGKPAPTPPHPHPHPHTTHH